MTLMVPEKEWWTTAELAESGLPDVPNTRQGVDQLVDRHGWRTHPEHCRRRSGRGGGWEYSWRLLPSRAQRKLLAAVAAPKAAKPKQDRAEAWAWYEGLPDSVKLKAVDRLLIIQKVEALEPAIGRDLAVREVARVSGQGARTVWGWLALVEGVRPDDRLPALAPRHRMAASKTPRGKDCDPEFFDRLKSDFLRVEAPSFSTSYRRALRVAVAEGLAVLPERTMRRRLDATC
ncbi:Mu DNA-binding domain-containing protein [Gemmobacter aquatilis]|uniref:Mu DNA-binding domain-containing protein n=1 Tax=Gemmobacter aquatilis TaxID=933059 RepID=A0A1H8NYV5_9RHOB|nr:DNA-binding domain-containing protein [Gemmobacter aquatilis]SEO34782.1 Mu DNA-binding domain-containing protein [Gemmobacter aquatilis]